jgi:hypothetical protein
MDDENKEVQIKYHCQISSKGRAQSQF